MARVTRLVCDDCGKEVEEAKGAVMRINFTDARRGSKQADLCDTCAGKMPGQAVARRGRRPKTTAAEKTAARAEPGRPLRGAAESAPRAFLALSARSPGVV